MQVASGSGEGDRLAIYIGPDDGNESATDTIYIDRMTWTPKGAVVEPTDEDAREISSISLSGGVPSLTFTNADERFAYNLRGTNELVKPLSLWPILWTTNGTGVITIAPPAAPSEKKFFYYLETIAR